MTSFSNSFILTLITKVLKIVFSIGSTIIITNVLGPTGQGIYKMSILLPSILITIGNLGLGQAGTYYISTKILDQNKIIGNNLLISNYFGAILLLIGCLITTFWGENIFPGINKTYLYITLCSIPFFLTEGILGGIFLGLKKIEFYNLALLLNSFYFFLIIFFGLIIFNQNVLFLIIGYSISSIFSLLTIIYLTKVLSHVIYKLEYRYLKTSIGYGFKVYLAGIANFLHYRVDILLINAYLNPEAVGLYSIATLLTEKLWIISQSIGEILFPRIASDNNRKNSVYFTFKILKVNILITTVGAIILSLFIKPIIIIFSASFIDSIVPFRILIIGAILMSCWRVLVHDLYGRKILNMPIIISISTLIINIFLNVILIPKYNIVGAAIATTVSYTLSCVFVLFHFIKVTNTSLLMFFKKETAIMNPIWNKIRLLWKS